MSIARFTGKILSMLFRIIIVLCGIYILVNKENFFDLHWYLLAIPPYIFFYFKTLFKEGIFSRLRLLNDFLFITIILYGKELDFLNVFFLSLPVINSPNHSGEKKSILLYVFYLSAFLIINNFIWSWPFIVLLLVLWMINILSNLRYQYFNNINKLNLQIEKFLEDDLELNKSYKIYEGIISALNSISVPLFPKPLISKIVCFKIASGNISLENSSEFIWSFSLDEMRLKQLIARPNENFSSNVPLVINGKERNNNFFVQNKSKDQQYLFIFISDEVIIGKIGVIYSKKVLKSIVNRISRIIGIENVIKDQNRTMLHDFRDKYFHIQNAEKAMHFIRNRFNTLDNFMEMSKDNINGVMDDEDLALYGMELERLERNYQMLMDRVKSILDKSDKPFSATKLELKSINSLFNLVREIWLDYFTEFNATVNINFNLAEKLTVKINSDGFYILVADWISNLKKYSNTDQKVIFSENDELFIITFENNFSKSSVDEVEALMNDFNSTERDKILQRTSFGVLIMKSILEEMNVKGVIEIENNILRLILTLKKETNENSNF